MNTELKERDIIESTAVAVVEEPKSLIDYEPAIEDAKMLLERRKALFSAILDLKEDIQQIKGKDFKKKSYWRKLASIYKVSLEHVKEWREEVGEELVYFFVYRATAPWGASVQATGSCSNKEKRETKSIHDTRATAETRAKNRAISDLLAFGEVSADELNQLKEDEKKDEKKTAITYNGVKKQYSRATNEQQIEPEWEDVPDMGELPKTSTEAPKPKKRDKATDEDKEHPNYKIVKKIGDLLTKEYAPYIQKEDFKDVMDKLNDGKWKDLKMAQLYEIYRLAEERCKKAKALAEAG